MSDAILNVMKYRGRLKAEIVKVDEFLHMAEEFSKAADPEERVSLMKRTAKATPPEKPQIDRPRASTNGAGSA